VIPLPPTKEVLETLQQDVLPGAGGAALVLCAFALLGRWAGALGSAVAVVFAFAWGNLKNNFEKLTWEATWRLIPWKLPDDADGRDYLARAALLLVAVGLVSRWLGLLAGRYLPERQWWGANVLVWAPRIAAVVVASGWLIIGESANAWPMLQLQIAGAMILGWVALDSLARSGAGAQVMAYLGAMLFTGGVIFLYAHSLRSAELAILLGSAMFGLALAAGAIAYPPVRDPDAWVFDSDFVALDLSGAVPAGVAFLPGLLLGARPWLAQNDVPPHCFWLVAFAPLVLLPFVVPALGRKTGWQVAIVRAVLVLAPLVAAVVLTGQHAQMSFE
jgi:hypothetical protein